MRSSWYNSGPVEGYGTPEVKTLNAKRRSETVVSSERRPADHPVSGKACITIANGARFETNRRDSRSFRVPRLKMLTQ
jgi:hypothetical protein